MRSANHPVVVLLVATKSAGTVSSLLITCQNASWDGSSR